MLGGSHVSSPPFVVSENATAGNLGAFLVRDEDNKRCLWRLLYQAGLGLEYLHHKGIVHGNLKLNNILVGVDGVAKLSDYGVTAVRACCSRLVASPTTVSGTLRWFAPECFTSRPGFASDIYSFAMCMIEAFISEPHLYSSATMMSVIM